MSLFHVANDAEPLRPEYISPGRCGSGCWELITWLPIGILQASAHWGDCGGFDRIIILNIFRLINYITKAKHLFLRCKWLKLLWLSFSYCRKRDEAWKQLGLGKGLFMPECLVFATRIGTVWGYILPHLSHLYLSAAYRDKHTQFSILGNRQNLFF